MRPLPPPHPSAVLVKQVVRGGGWLALGLTVSYFVFRKIRIFAKQVTNLPSSDCFAQLVSHAVVENTKEETANSSPCRYGGVQQTAIKCRSPPPPTHLLHFHPAEIRAELWGGGMCKGSVLLQAHTHTRTRTGAPAHKDINAFAFSPLNLSNPLIFGIVKYAKVTKVNR